MEWNIHKSSCQQILTYFTSQFISRSTRNQTPQIKSTDPSRAQLRSWPPPIRYVPSGLQWNPRGIEAKSHSQPVPMCHSAGFLFLALLVSAKGELRLEKTTLKMGLKETYVAYLPELVGRFAGKSHASLAAFTAQMLLRKTGICQTNKF